MRSKIMRAGIVTALVAAFLSFALAESAAAHEEQSHAGYDWVVGFGDEPAYAGYPNSVALLLSQGGKPVTKIPGDLEVAVEFGEGSIDLQLEPYFEVGEFGTPGDYRAWFIPTRPGKYTFHFTGTLGGEKVDESFTSSPNTFDEVTNPTSEEFPVQDPTTGELAERIDREIPRLGDQVATATEDAQNAADSATTLAIVALVVGAIGAIAGVVGIALGRKRG